MLATKSHPFVRSKNWLSGCTMYLTLIAAGGLLLGCDSSSESGLSSQDQQLLDRLQAPVITHMNALGSPAYPGSQLEISVSAYSPLERSLSYEWSVPDEWDVLDENSDRITVQAPYEKALTTPVTVVVSDGSHSQSASLDLATRGPAIEQFSIVATPDANQIESIDFSVNAFNRDGGLLSYQYRLGGSAMGEDLPQWQWQAERVIAPGFYDVSVTVSDEGGLTSSAYSTFWLPGISNWTTAGGDRQSTRRSGADVNGPTLLPTDIWAYGAGTSNFSAPAIGPDGMIYAILNEGDDLKIAAIDPTALPANRLAWEWSEAALNTGDHQIEYLSNIVLGDNSDLFVAGCLSNDNCYIFRLNTQAETDATRLNIARTIEDFRTSLPTMLSIDQQGVVYLANGRFVRAFTFGESTSREYWNIELEHWVRNYALGNDNTLYAVQESSGSKYMLSAIKTRYSQAGSQYEWRDEAVARRGGSDFYLGMVTGSDGTLYALTKSHLTAIEVDDLSVSPSISWVYPPEGQDPWSYEFNARSLLIHESTLYLVEGVGGDEILMAFDLSKDKPTPKVIWEPGADARIRSAPAMSADGTLYLFGIENGDGAVFALDSRLDTSNDERLLWKSTGHDPGTNARLLIGDGLVVITSTAGVLLLKE
ncbi:MAG: hypothetical protein LAT65_00880 [Saccharospirillum sp.]|nr:hypothetical protein [Saccharospirillum sp.]